MHINLSGYITNKTSYGLVTLNLLKELAKRHTVDVHDFDKNSDLGEFNTLVRQCILPIPNLKYNSPSLRIAHQFDMAKRIGRGKSFGYTFSEVDSLTELEKVNLNSLDTVIVPTEWAKEIYHKEGIENIKVCPAGYDHTIFSPVEYMPPKCVFLSLGKWEIRKQQGVIVECFKKAFGASDNVELWMSCDNRFAQDFVEAQKSMYKQALGDRIKLIGHISAPSGIARLMQQSYCFVAPSLAEGWNLPLLEAMACGKMNIATNYSGHTEFCTPETTVLIEPTGLTPAVDGMWFREKSPTNCGNWCTYNQDDLIESMRLIYGKYKDGVVLNQKAHDAAKYFTWEESSKTVEDILYER